MSSTPAPAFQLRTVDGQTYTQGDTNPFGFGDPAARLESVDSDGDFLVLSYTGGFEVWFPEARVQYVAQIVTPAEAEAAA